MQTVGEEGGGQEVGMRGKDLLAASAAPLRAALRAGYLAPLGSCS